MLHRINIEPAQTTLVPQKIFPPEWSSAIAELNFQFDPERQCVLSEIHNNLVFVSVVDKQTYDAALSLFPTGEYYSTYRLLFQAFEKLARSDKRNRHQIFAHIAPNTLDLFVFEKHIPIFVNTFSLRTPNDLLYYLLHVMNRLKIDTGGLVLKMIDSASHSRHLMQTLESHFLSVVKLSDRENPLNLRVPVQPGFSLINSALCE